MILLRDDGSIAAHGAVVCVTYQPLTYDVATFRTNPVGQRQTGFLVIAGARTILFDAETGDEVNPELGVLIEHKVKIDLEWARAATRRKR